MKFSKFLNVIVNQLLKLVDTLFISKIENEIVRAGLRSSLEPLRQTLDALTDNVPRDSAQVEEIWKRYVKTQGLEYAEALVIDSLHKIKDERLKILFLTLAQPIFETVKLIAENDGEIDNEKVKEIWQNFVKLEDNQKVLFDTLIFPILEKVVKDKKVLNIIKNLLN